MWVSVCVSCSISRVHALPPPLQSCGGHHRFTPNNNRKVAVIGCGSLRSLLKLSSLTPCCGFALLASTRGTLIILNHASFLATWFCLFCIVVSFSPGGLRCLRHISAGGSRFVISHAALLAIKNDIPGCCHHFLRSIPTNTVAQQGHPLVKERANTVLPPLTCSQPLLSCMLVFSLPQTLVLLAWTVGVHLSAEINGGLVLVVLDAERLLFSVIELFYTCLLLAF